MADREVPRAAGAAVAGIEEAETCACNVSRYMATSPL